MTEPGHNSGEVNASHLRAFIERIEKVNEQRDALGDDLKDIYAEVKSAGFDRSVVKKVVAIRRMDQQKRMEQEEILDLYLTSLGMVD